DKTSAVFSQDDIAFLNEVGETILPATATPGAKAANVGEFMTVMVNDCYTENDQKTFHEGMAKLNSASKKKFNASFMKLTPEQRHDLLVELDKESKDYQKKKSDFDSEQNKKEAEEKAKGNTGYKKEEMPSHYFRMMKELTMLGYFTSKIGCTEARRYVAVPGKFEGCIPYKKGDKAFA
ncbi:MAG: gluconate 2-dehydrogenase subunit 3 family protein, partial [Bacteroidota bacterium]|nr:gluconate 2-dehydrogenase subunit 3 family protein [Bacteroidota bacterium]